LLGIRAGRRDAKAGRPPFLWAIVTNPAKRPELLRTARKDVAKVFFLALTLDVVFQLVIFHWVYPGEAILVASALACIPYALIRGLANRFFRAR
jgi:hypothetical protein